MQVFRTGLIVAVFLALLTVGEYWAAAGIHDDFWRFVVIAAGTIFEAWLIVWYYMHVYRLWREEGAH